MSHQPTGTLALLTQGLPLPSTQPRQRDTEPDRERGKRYTSVGDSGRIRNGQRIKENKAIPTQRQTSSNKNVSIDKLLSLDELDGFDRNTI